MLFKYKVIDNQNVTKEGVIDAPDRDLAIGGLQRRGFVIISIKDDKEKFSIFSASFFDKISPKEIVILSRQISTLFDAQVSALKIFTMLAQNSDNKLLARNLTQIGDDVKAGVSISRAFAKYPEMFSDFYVNMVRVGEEAGKLNKTFEYLADYLDRQYSIVSKVKNALIYPCFVIFTFFVVMALMFTVVIPKLSGIILDMGQEVPFYTKVVIALSNFFVAYGFIVIIILIILGIWLWQLSFTQKGKEFINRIRFSIPVIGNLYKMLYLSRIADNLDTMFISGVPIVRAIDVTATVVDSNIYKSILKGVSDDVRSGIPLSSSFAKYPEEIPGIMVQMIKVGEETGSLGEILKTLFNFYSREVNDSIDTLVGLIEPVMIVVLGLGVGILLVSVLVPIYNLAGGIG
ncbi:MAG: type II secretion system F family protein [Patescibacteria group bacterium]